MENIVSSKALVETLKTQAKQKIKYLEETLGILPKLTILMAGDNPASKSYVAKKVELAKECGMESDTIYLDENKFLEYDKVSTDLNRMPEVNGFMLQLPCPNRLIEVNETLKDGFNINSIKDVDCLEEQTYAKMLDNEDEAFTPCTPLGILRYLEFLNVDIEGKHFAIIGKSRLVGKPLADLLLAKGATITICHSQTINLAKAIENADVVICAVGKKDLLNKDNVKPHHILIDVGINKVDGKLYGDVSEDAKSIAKIVTPVPGGVGPLTVMSLITNTIDACYMQNGLNRPSWQVK
jgi:methylenetetrahydrofolate dehydrogenase (NADP+) / methenyltetrahydrofolate cyclohydrolase